MIKIFRTPRDRLSRRLVNRFIEAHQVFDVAAREAPVRMSPQPNDAAPWRAVFRSRLAEGEPALGAIGDDSCALPAIEPRVCSLTHAGADGRE